MPKLPNIRALNAILAVMVAFGPLASVAKASIAGSMAHGPHLSTGGHAHHVQEPARAIDAAAGVPAETRHAGQGHGCDQSGGCSSSCCTACAHCLAVMPLFQATIDRPGFSHVSAVAISFSTLVLPPQIRPPQF